MQLVFVIGAIVTTLMTGPLVDYFVAKERLPAEADRQTSGVAIFTSYRASNPVAIYKITAGGPDRNDLARRARCRRPREARHVVARG